MESIASGVKSLFIGIAILLVLGNLWALPALARSSDPQTEPASTESSDKGGESGLGGPSSVAGTLGQDRETTAPARVDLLDRYLGFKQRVQEAYGFSFGFDYNALFQAATSSPGEDVAAGGAFRAFGQWTLIGRGSGNTGTLVFKVEYRHRLGTDIAPKNLGFETGYAGLTALVFRDDLDPALTNLYWSQKLLENRLAFVIGVVDVTDYIDVYGLVNVWTDFNNYAFTTNPTIYGPDQGLGAALRVMPTENLYILGGIADANGNPSEPGDFFDSFFNDAEYFTHLEVGWISSWERRYNDNIHLTAWHIDEREEAGTDAGWGLAFSFGRLLADTWEPFFRAGYSEDGGALWEGSVSAGVGYHTRKQSDVLGVGLNWSRPSEGTLGPGLDDQYTAEIYYRWRVVKIVTITPDVQLLFNPALNPDEDVLAVFGIRGRISL